MSEQADMETESGDLQRLDEEVSEPEMAICPRCDGCGETTPWDHTITHACPVCNGTGERQKGGKR